MERKTHCIEEYNVHKYGYKYCVHDVPHTTSNVLLETGIMY